MGSKAVPIDDLPRVLGSHRAAIVTHCYRMLGSLADAEEVAQEVLTRGWRHRASFQGHASMRTWLLRIATNACLDELRARPRRVLPVQESAPVSATDALPSPLERRRFVDPFPDALADTDEPGPEARYAAYESIGLAFVAALQHLTPPQRAVLLLRDVLGWSATEVASHLELSVSAANSALHRARLAVRQTAPARAMDAAAPSDAALRDLLDRYVRAWTAGDATGLAALLRTDGTFSMPPQPAWVRGPAEIASFLRARVFGDARWALVPTRANGAPAFGVYRGDGSGAPMGAHALHVLEVAGSAIASIVCFLDAPLLPRFGLAPQVDA